jgi:hypothetical protein
MTQQHDLNHAPWERKYHVVFIPTYRMRSSGKSRKTSALCSTIWPGGANAGSRRDKISTLAEHSGHSNRRECRKIVRRAFDVIASPLHAVMPKDNVRHSPDIATSSGEIDTCVLDQGEDLMLVITVEEHV